MVTFPLRFLSYPLLSLGYVTLCDTMLRGITVSVDAHDVEFYVMARRNLKILVPEKYSR